MTVYRVFESYHERSESGTIEYGTFSSRSLAEARLAAVWAQKQYPPPSSRCDESGWFGRDKWTYYSIEIREVMVDEETDRAQIGYT